MQRRTLTRRDMTEAPVVKTSALLSAVQRLIARSQKKRPSAEEGTVNGYTVPLRGSVGTPELDYILAYREPLKKAKVSERRLACMNEKWAKHRAHGKAS